MKAIGPVTRAVEKIRRVMLRWTPPLRVFDIFITVADHIRWHKEWPSLQSPKNFNQLVLRQKIRQRDPVLVSFTSDKELAKHYIRGKLAEAGYSPHTFLPATIRICENLDDPWLHGVVPPCVIKPTHSTGAVVVVQEPRVLTADERIALAYSFKKSAYHIHRENHYQPLRPKLIAEELILDPNGGLPRDFKVFCLRGTPLIVEVDFDRFGAHTRNFYAMDWTLLPMTMDLPQSLPGMDEPIELDEMIRISHLLSKDFDLVRIDFYITGKRLVLGEITHTSGAGQTPMTPRSFEFDFMDETSPLWRVATTALKQALAQQNPSVLEQAYSPPTAA